MEAARRTAPRRAGGTGADGTESQAVEVRILGPLAVVDDGGRKLDLGTRKQRAVVAVLALAVNRTISCDRMIEDLWGTEPPAKASGSLQAYVSNLRRVLEPDRRPREPARVLVTQGPGYSLRLEPASVDAYRFEAAARDGRRQLAQGRPELARRTLAGALRLWRGSVLADFAFEPLVQVEASRLGELRLVATEDHLQAGLAMGADPGAIAELEALVAAHPLRERLRGLLMVALHLSGRRADALQAYRSAGTILAEELGIDPGPDLRRLEADIRADTASLEWFLGEPGRVPAPVPASIAVAATLSGGNDLVGREPETARLEQALARAAARRGGVVLVTGEPGIGKTRLVQEAVGRASGTTVVWGRGVEAAATPAYWPWVEVLRALVDACEPDRLRAAIGTGGPELARIVPEVKEITGPLDPPGALDPDTARQHLCHAVSTFLLALAEDRPVVVVLDDLHWADVASLQLLGAVAACLRDSRLLVIGTYRPADADHSGPFGETLAMLARHEVIDRLDLAGLDEAGVRGLVAAVTGAEPARDVAATVFSRTDGNPFFVTELARLLVSERGLSVEAVARVVPAGVGDVVRRRVRRLPEETTALLALAAVAGRDFDSRTLERAAAIDADQALDLLEVALASGLVVEDAEEVGRFRFSHDLVREVVLGEVSAVRRSRLHARVGDAVEARHGDDPAHAVELAHHLFHAGAAIAPARAIAAILRAAEVATTRVAHEQAEEQLRRARSLVARLPPGLERDGRELDVLLRLHPLLMATKGWAAPDTGEVLARAHALCGPLGRSRELVPVLYGLFAFHLGSSAYGTAAELAEQLMDVATRSGDPAHLVVAHEASGLNAVHVGDFGAARNHFASAQSLTGGLADPWLATWFPMDPTVGYLTFGGWNLWLLGDGERGRQMMEEAVAFAGRHAQATDTAHALHCVAFLAVSDRDQPRLQESAEAALQASREQGMQLYSAFNAVLLGWTIAATGDVDGGLRRIEEGLVDLAATGTCMHLTFFKALLAEVQQWAGRTAEALGSVDEGLDLALRTGERFWEAELHRLRGELIVALDPDRRADAEEAILAAVAVARTQECRPLAARAEDSLARLLRKS